MQALVWKDALENNGHVVVLINAWGEYNWNSFDIIHVFSYCDDSLEIVRRLKKRGIKVVVSPIIDSIKSKSTYRIASYIGIKRLKLYSLPFILRHYSDYVDAFIVRSQYESGFLTHSSGIPDDKVFIVPLSYRSNIALSSIPQKEQYCLHVSSITQSRKNVMRLIQAAVKYDFELILAGSTGTNEAYEPYRKMIESHKNIKSLGFVSDERLEELYSHAKVFALPSIMEGVGLVALEAAMHGCDVVITSIGGPKEYYGDYAYTVNPYSIDDIGKTIVKALNETKQPGLFNHIEKEFSIKNTVLRLESVYRFLES